MKLQNETINEISKLSVVGAPRTIAEQAMRLGVANDEPLLICMDSMLRYAKAYRKRFEQSLADDYVLGPPFGKAIAGIRFLLNGNGAVAMERDVTTDSKDNGVIEALYWECCKVAGLNGDEL